jgi:broad specificity phosphatase PhoE
VSEPLLVTLLRHGDVAGRPFVFRGASDPPLSERGWTQMRHAYAAAALPPPQAVATSPLARCREFALPAAHAAGIPCVVHADLAEMRFGAWEELSADEVRAMDAPRFDAFRADPRSVTPPDGEAYEAFTARVAGALAALATAHRGHLLVVTHAGVIRAALGQALGLAPAALFRIALPAAATCRLSLLSGEAPVLLALNFASPEPCAA